MAGPLRAVSEAITSHADVQDWLRTAAFEAAMRLEGEADVQATSMAYATLLDDLEHRFPVLLEAVSKLTGGCARLALDWRPLYPQYSRLYLDFGVDFSVDRFYLLNDFSGCSFAITAVSRGLPPGFPFPNRPNEANGIIAHGGRCVGLRIREHNIGGGRRRTIAFLPMGYQPLENLSETEAAEALRQFFSDPRPAPH